MALDPYSIALGAVGLYAIILHMGVVYLYTAKSYAEDSSYERDRVLQHIGTLITMAPK